MIKYAIKNEDGNYLEDILSGFFVRELFQAHLFDTLEEAESTLDPDGDNECVVKVYYACYEVTDDLIEGPN